MSDVDPRMAGSEPAEESGAVRLIFEYDGDDVKLVASQPVDVVAQPSDPLTRGEDRSGFWVELRAQSEDVLYRQVLSDPGRVHPEVFSPDPSVGIARTAEPQPAGAFSVLVPQREAGSHVVLMSSPPAGTRGGPTMAASPDAPAQEIARFALGGPAGQGGSGS